MFIFFTNICAAQSHGLKESYKIWIAIAFFPFPFMRKLRISEYQEFGQLLSIDLATAQIL